MNLENLKISGVGTVNINDSLNAPIIRLKLTKTADTVVPNNGNLIIYVDKSETSTEERKTYIFNNTDNIFNDLNDEFIIEPVYKEKKVYMDCYIKKSTGEITNLDYQEIILFENANYISTNIENVEIEIVYPKNIELVKYFFINSLVNGENDLTLEDIYFKDAFTKTTDGINIDANNLNINCLTSNNESFSLDNSGNLVVNTITTVSGTTFGYNIDNVYPIGSIYMNVGETNPTTLFGGTWERIQDTFLLASGTTFANNTTGGEKTHKLTIDEMPSHRHNMKGYWRGSGNLNQDRVASYNEVSADNANSSYGTTSIQSAGGNKEHNNMPPYLTVYMWKRIS